MNSNPNAAAAAAAVKAKWNVNKMKVEADLLPFYNHYMEKFAKDSGVLLREAPPSDYASLIVVDMQNDFIYLPKGVVDKYKLNQPIGRFCVESGLSIVDPMVQFIDRNAPRLSKIIYTRDAHPINHCSFFTNEDPGPFPPHCIANHYGAALHPKIRDIAKKYPGKSAVVFKGCSDKTDSFGGEKYPDPTYMKRRQVGSCCDGLTPEDCMKNTGGRYLNETLIDRAADDYPFVSIKQYTDNSNDPLFEADCPESTFANMSKDLGKEFQIEDLLAGQTEGTHTIYVVGLAADMCVKDTAVNIMKKLAPMDFTLNGVKINVVVIQDLTRYVFLPIQLINPGGVYKREKLVNAANFKTKNTTKDVNKYLFQYVEGGIKRLTQEEAASADLSDMGQALKKDANPNGYAAFTSPIKDIVQHYKESGVKLIMVLPELPVVTNLSKSGLLNIAGGARRKNKTRKNCWPKPKKGGKRGTRKPMGHKKGCKCVICKRR